MALRQDLIDYSNFVISGEIIACQKHKWACMRFLRDLSHEGAEEFPYVFNEERGEHFLNWMRLFKHRQGLSRIIGTNIEPHIIQKFVFGNIYGWYHKDTGYRRFRKMYWQVARKNAKSQSLACVASYELMVFTKGRTEIYCGATKTEQARIVWDETKAMLEECKLLKGKFRVAYSKIIHDKTDSVFRALSEEDRKTGDGLNVQCGIIDEYHAHDTSEILDILVTGGGARPEPFFPIITTAGPDLSYPCYRVEYDLCSKILNPDIKISIDAYFVMINELDKNDTAEPITINGREVPSGELIDDIKDESTWIKANPIQCSYPEGVDFIRKELKEALEAPEKMRNFLTKLMDVWVNQKEASYMNMAKWAACYVKDHLISVNTCILGLDLSSKLDLTSGAFEFKDGKKYYLRSHSFIPSETLTQKIKTDKVPYDLWIREGWISLIDGARIEYLTVADYFIDFAKKNKWAIKEICVDPWGAAQITKYLEDKGYTVVEIIQGIKTLSEPTKNFKEEAYAGNVIHDNDPVLSWAISNAIVDEVDRNKNIILNKKKSKQRIDPIAAVINAHVRAMVGENESVYNRRGLISMA
jgi:phage terminase large subunit-like protein